MVRSVSGNLATLVATLAVGILPVVLAVTPAGAHTDFVGSDPKDGATLGQVPREVALEFSDDMDPQLSTITVRVEGGRSTPLRVTSGAKPTVLAAAIPDAQDLPDGSATRWTITFRVVSRDGHPVVGTTQFLVRPPRTPSSTEKGDDGAAIPSDEGSAETGQREAAAESTDAANDRAVWPLVALGVGALLVVVGAVGAVMRLVGRDRDA